jgi:hypothetical protein
VTTAGYQIRPPRDVAVIGAGGGRDILSALLSGAERIEAIELNPRTIDIVSRDFGAVSGDIYHRPGVHAVAAEGRSRLQQSGDPFDFIQISLIDSWAASAAGAFALAENSLYTVEAFRLYLDRLAAGGLVSTSRWMSELPRLLLLARAALVDRGVAEPGRHMLLLSASEVGTLLLSPSPFTAADLARADEVAASRGFERLYPPPEPGPPTLATEIIDGRVAGLAAAGVNVRPPTDDSPYFFQVVSPFTDPARVKEALPDLTGLEMNFGSTQVLRQTLLVVSVIALLCFGLPLLSRAGRGQGRGPLGGLLRGSLFFAAIGAGFMLLENMLLQRSVLYLGHPSYAVSVVIAALLFGMGLGSRVSGRLGLLALQRFGWLLPLLLAAVVAVLPALFEATLGAPRPLRILLSCGLLAPLGALLGLFFPLGMLRFGDADKPWFWAINGGFGVVAGVLSLAFSMEWGYSVVGRIAAFCYALAWLCVLAAPRTAPRPSPP